MAATLTDDEAMVETGGECASYPDGRQKAAKLQAGAATFNWVMFAAVGGFIVLLSTDDSYPRPVAAIGVGMVIAGILALTRWRASLARHPELAPLPGGAYSVIFIALNEAYDSYQGTRPLALLAMGCATVGIVWTLVNAWRNWTPASASR